jgi:hypothetical protein
MGPQHHYQHQHAALPQTAPGDTNGRDFHRVPGVPKAGTISTGWFILWATGGFLAYSSMEQWDRGWVIANLCISGAVIVLALLLTAARAVRYARALRRHAGTITALAFTGTITAPKQFDRWPNVARPVPQHGGPPRARTGYPHLAAIGQPCYQLASGAMVHIVPACRCPPAHSAKQRR